MNEQTFTDQELSNEIWKPIIGFENRYVISNLGRVKRLTNETSKHRKSRILKTAFNKAGYERVGLTTEENKQIKYYVHRLVAFAFLNETDTRKQINHKDGNKGNNRLENLEFTTAQENIKHAQNIGLFKTGLRHHYSRRPETIRKGEKHPLAKFSDLEVLKIRERLANGETGLGIANELGVAKGVIYAIKHRKTWAHI